MIHLRIPDHDSQYPTPKVKSELSRAEAPSIALSKFQFTFLWTIKHEMQLYLTAVPHISQKNYDFYTW